MSVSQNGGAMPKVRQSSGWRKATAGLSMAEQYARAGEQSAVPKSKAFVAVKRVASHIGLKAGDMLLLDTLGAFTQIQDWQEGQRPIVWVSNAFLIEQTGFSLSALKRHSRRLAEIGLISFRDSPNGKRWGKRDDQGRIIEAYGFDLSPLSARIEEFESLQAELRAERELCQRLKRQITVTRRMIRGRIEAALSAALNGPWERLTQAFDELLNRLPRRHTGSETLAQLLTWFRSLQEHVESAYHSATHAPELEEKTQDLVDEFNEKPSEMNPKGVENGPHTLTTKQLIPVIRNRTETEPDASEAQASTPQVHEDNRFAKQHIEPKGKQKASLDLPTVVQACPEFASWAHNLGGYLKDWGDLHRIAGQLRPMIGVSEQVWNLAQEQLGHQMATAAMVLTFDKHCAGEVTSPGGYLHGIVQKSGAGELHLARSFYGRLSEQKAA